MSQFIFTGREMTYRNKPISTLNTEYRIEYQSKFIICRFHDQDESLITLTGILTLSPIHLLRK